MTNRAQLTVEPPRVDHGRDPTMAATRPVTAPVPRIFLTWSGQQTPIRTLGDLTDSQLCCGEPGKSVVACSGVRVTDLSPKGYVSEATIGQALDEDSMTSG